MALILANQMVDGLQKFFIDEDKKLLQGAIDSVQVIIAKAIDDIPNGPQFRAMLLKIEEAVTTFKDSGEE